MFRPEGDMHLYQFIIIFGVFTMILAQLPSFHSLRHVNFAATVLTLTFSAIALGGSLYVGEHFGMKNADAIVTRALEVASLSVCCLYKNAC